MSHFSFLPHSLPTSAPSISFHLRTWPAHCLPCHSSHIHEVSLALCLPLHPPDLPNILGKSPADAAPINGPSFPTPPPSSQERLPLLVPSKCRAANSFPLLLVPTYFTPLSFPSPAYTYANNPFITFSSAKQCHGLIWFPLGPWSFQLSCSKFCDNFSVPLG